MDKEKPSFFARLKKIKGIGFIAVALAAALLLLLIPAGESANEVSGSQAASSEEYCAQLESKAEELICELDEVKGCKVVITLESGYRFVYATDQAVNEAYNDSGTQVAKEVEKKIVFAEDENGKTPVLIDETPPGVAGVAVVCVGASYETQYKIISLMCALFDLSSNRISVQT